MEQMRLYYGVIEDSSTDPLRLGRCKVRVIGIHTDDKTILPTADLPWATPIQGITSAALSGIGESPTGLLQGSTVVVTFADGPSAQIPLILGTIAGIPQGSAQDFVTGDVPEQPIYSTGDITPPVTQDGTELKNADQGGGFVAPAPEPLATGEIGPLSNDDYIKYREKIAEKESKGSGGYSAINTLNFLGKYQFGAGKLVDYGYMKKGSTQKDVKNSSYWLGKDGISSYTDFLKNHAVQEACMKKMTKNNFAMLRRAGVLRNDSDSKHCAGLLAVAHLKGGGDAIKFGRGEPVKPDAYGTSAAKYYKVGFASLDGEVPTIMPTDDSSLPIDEIKQTTATGFSDPNGVWPRKKYLREPDTNRLVRAQGISSTVVGKKESARDLNIRLANSGTTWSQPHVPYATVYPYNKVMSTENGHIQEFDDTPGAIRYHLYHPAGTFTEIDNNGTKVNRIVGDNYEIIDRNGYVHIKGDCNITVEGNANILVQEKCELEVYGDCDAVFKNNVNTTVHGTMNTFVQEDINIKCKSFNVSTFDGDINMTSAKSLKTIAVNDTLMETGDNFGAKAGKQFGTESGEDTSMTIGAGFSMQSSTNISFKTSADIVGDGTGTYFQAGMSIPSTPVKDTIANSAVSNSGGSSLSDPIEHGLIRQEIIDANISKIVYPPSYIDSMGAIYESPDDGEMSDDYKNNLKDIYLSIGDIDMAEMVGIAEGVASQTFEGRNSLTGKRVDCSIFLNEEEIPMGTQLSDNYSLAQLCASQMAPKKLVKQHGVSVGELVCNLKHLAINVLEPVKDLYPDVVITSCLRRAGAGQEMDKNKKSVSAHELGQAVDLQFGPQYSVKDYFNIAKDLAGKIDYDSIILEYNNNLRTCWVHISWKTSGNRKYLGTYSNQKKYANGLKKLV
jgi:hypothetical protein